MSFLIAGGVDNPLAQATQLLGEPRQLDAVLQASVEVVPLEAGLTSALGMGVEDQSALMAPGRWIMAEPDPIGGLLLAGFLVEDTARLGQLTSTFLLSTDTSVAVVPPPPVITLIVDAGDGVPWPFDKGPGEWPDLELLGVILDDLEPY